MSNDLRMSQPQRGVRMKPTARAVGRRVGERSSSAGAKKYLSPPSPNPRRGLNSSAHSTQGPHLVLLRQICGGPTTLSRYRYPQLAPQLQSQRGQRPTTEYNDED